MIEHPARAARRASGLLDVDALRDPARTGRVQRLVDAAAGSSVLAGLVDLASRITGTSCAQLSLLTGEQVATAVRCSADVQLPERLALHDSLCSVTVLSGDVLVAADAQAHPWLGDLLPVERGVVGAYLGVPLRLPDGTQLGALCVWETAARTWSDRDVGLTCAVADLVALELTRLAGG